jgi:hypothetical protein
VVFSLLRNRSVLRSCFSPCGLRNSATNERIAA